MLLLPLPDSLVPFLSPYLPQQTLPRPFVTLTWAQSLDGRIAAAPGLQTKISHAETKTMTHYLRSKHDAILVGVGTVLADDPKLNCRYDSHKIRPVVVDPHGRWNYAASQLRGLCDRGDGLAPLIVVKETTQVREEDVLVAQGGAYVRFPFETDNLANWEAILAELGKRGIKSVMVEGGAHVINTLLPSDLVDSIVITIGPVFLGAKGVQVAPAGNVTLQEAQWWKGTQDTVVATKKTQS